MNHGFAVGSMLLFIELVAIFRLLLFLFLYFIDMATTISVVLFDAFDTVIAIRVD
jgi:hypothetical protein